MEGSAARRKGTWLAPLLAALMVGLALLVVAMSGPGLPTRPATASSKAAPVASAAPDTGGGKQTPLLMRVLDPPEPVKGTDGKYHLVYELVLTNSSPGTATVQSIQTIDPKTGEVVDSLARAEVAARTVLLGDISGATADKIGSGRVALVFLDATFKDLRDVPKHVEHRVRTSFDIPAGFGSNLFPKQTTDVGAGTGVSRKKPVVLSPPLKGKNWVAFNGCCTVSPHRGAMFAIDQKLLATERYAIDWVQGDNEGNVPFPDANHTKLTDFPAYGDPVFSVAGGRVVKVVDKFPDAKPGQPDPDLTLEEAAGNHVILYIGGGRYAFYAHLKPGSIKVEEGDRVRSGQRIATLGNSGNTSEPHLHFHVMDGPLPLGADHNLPYVFDSFRYQGHMEIGEQDLTPVLLENPVLREDELPLALSIATFPAPRGR